jgi:hypothetical protein
MAKTFTGKDVHDWKVVTYGGAELIRDSKGKPARFDGYKDASAAVRKVGGVAIRA